MATILPALQINATTLHLVKQEKDYLVIAIEKDIPHACFCENSAIESLLSRREFIAEYILDTYTPVVTRVSNKPETRLARFLICVSKDTDILFY